MNRLRSVAILAMLALLVVACGRSNTGAGGSGAPNGTPLSSGPVSGNLTVWAMGTEGEKLSVLAKDFTTANPGVTVKVTAIPWSAAHDKINAAITAGTTPDVSLIGTTWMGEFANAGALDPTPSSIAKSQFFPGAWDTTVVNGTSYGVPWYVETRVIYYRKDLAEKAGIMQPPASWDALKALAKGVVAKAGAKWGISLQAGGTGSWQTVMPFVWQAGGAIVDASGKTFALDAQPNIDALSYYKSFFTDKLSPTALDPGALEAGFINGSIGAFISGPWHVGILKDQSKSDPGFMSKVGLALMPKNKAGTSFVGGGDVAVFKNTKNRAAAWKFVQYLSQPDVQVKWYQTVSDLPSVQSAWDNAAISADKYLPTFRDQLKDAKAPPAIPNWEQVAAKVDSEVEKLTKTAETPDAAAKAMQQQATSIGTGF
jgi:multiple sugar transport system substrate-binding protein